MIYHTARYADKLAEAVAKGDETAIKKWDDKMGFTPILKGF